MQNIDRHDRPWVPETMKNPKPKPKGLTIVEPFKGKQDDNSKEMILSDVHL